MYENLAIVAIFAFLYSNIAGRLDKTPINGPLIFMIFGLLMGPTVLGILDFDTSQNELRVLADLTLALILFIDAANANLNVFKKESHIPLRMLLIGLPLVIASGYGLGLLLFPQLGLFEVALIATMLAATDAALGKAVITNKLVPERIREGLNAESGLNDGLCVPIIFTFLALAVATEGEVDGGNLALGLVARELGIGLLVGLGLTAIAGLVVQQCHKQGWITDIWNQVIVVALATACFATAQSLHGSGYIAAFVGGLLFGWLAGKDTHRMVLASEGAAEALALFTWVLFGAAVVGQIYQFFTWEIVAYAVLSLTVIRMLPMYLSLMGTTEKPHSRLFLGWFGPRGLASIVFLIIVLNAGLPGSETIVSTVICTITLSVILHGFTANGLAKWLGNRESASTQE
jgi:NhaP-type Na+/H+ or K+/H+ antiporter